MDEIDLSHLFVKEVDDWGNLTEYGVLKIKQRTAARKARDTIRRRYHTEFEWVKPEFPIYSMDKLERGIDNARAEPNRVRQEQTRSMEASGLEAYAAIRQRIAAL